MLFQALGLFTPGAQLHTVGQLTKLVQCQKPPTSAKYKVTDRKIRFTLESEANIVSTKMEHNSNLSFSAMQLEGLIDQGINHTFSAHLTTNHSLCSRHLPRGGLEPEVIKTLMCFLTNQQDFFIETMLPYSCVAEMFTGLGYLTFPKF